MPIKTWDFIFLLGKIYLILAFAYFIFLLNQAMTSSGLAQAGSDITPQVARALLWPKDAWLVWQGAR